jgi:hypothetical protein
MTDEKVRGYWLGGAPEFVRIHFPADQGRRLLEGLPQELKLSIDRVEPAAWYPRAHHVALLRALGSMAKEEDRVFEDLLNYGQFVATRAFAGELKPFMAIVSPRLFVKKLPDLWARDHRGESKLEGDFAKLEEARLPLKLSGIRGYDHVGVVTLGWIKTAIGTLVGRTPRVKQAGWSVRHSAPSEMLCEVSW